MRRGRGWNASVLLRALWCVSGQLTAKVVRVFLKWQEERGGCGDGCSGVAAALREPRRGRTLERQRVRAVRGW